MVPCPDQMIVCHYNVTKLLKTIASTRNCRHEIGVDKRNRRAIDSCNAKLHMDIPLCPSTLQPGSYNQESGECFPTKVGSDFQLLGHNLPIGISSLVRGISWLSVIPNT